MRIDDKRIQEVARSFRAGRGRAWSWVGSDIREALLDAEVMDLVRAAHASDNENPITPAQLVAVREQLARMLADGISYGSAGRVRFDVES